MRCERSDATIAEQIGEVLAQHGLPRPTRADDDRVGGWQLMYQLLERDAWVIADNCVRLIDCLPQLVRDTRRVEDVRKVDGDDPADAARYGLIPGARYAGVGAHSGAPGAGYTPPPNLLVNTPQFIPGIPLDEQIARYVSAQDPTSIAIQSSRLEAEALRQLQPRKRPTHGGPR